MHEHKSVKALARLLVQFLDPYPIQILPAIHHSVRYNHNAKDLDIPHFMRNPPHFLASGGQRNRNPKAFDDIHVLVGV